jgi:hypothetical protein
LQQLRYGLQLRQQSPIFQQHLSQLNGSVGLLATMMEALQGNVHSRQQCVILPIPGSLG